MTTLVDAIVDLGIKQSKAAEAKAETKRLRKAWEDATTRELALERELQTAQYKMLEVSQAEFDAHVLPAEEIRRIVGVPGKVPGVTNSILIENVKATTLSHEDIVNRMRASGIGSGTRV